MTINKAMKMSDIVLVKYLFQADWEPLEDVIEANARDFGDIYEVDNDNEVLQVAKTSAATLVIACVRSKEDLAKVLNFLKITKKILKDSNYKISVVNYLQNKNVESAFMKLGCQEVLDPNLKSKPLKFKMDFWKKALAAGANKKLNDQNRTVKDNRADGAGGKKEAPQVKWTEPLKIVDDMWITKSPQDTKRILNRWMIKLMGPSPFVAQWVEVDGQKGLWQFVFKDGIRDNFQMADGDWFFRGEQKPEFVWKDNLWLISGQKIQLFYQEEETVTARFRTIRDSLEISKNSSYAIQREKAIIETFDQEVLVKKGVVDNSKTSIDADQKIADGTLAEDIDGNDHLAGHMKGKNSKEKAIEDKEHNVGKDNINLDNLEGDSETDDLSSSFYDGKVKNKNKDKSNQDKKSAASDELFDEDGDAGTDDIGVQKYKGKMEHGRSDRKSDYGGKSETDDFGSAHWSNQKNSTDKERSDRDKEVEDELDGNNSSSKESKVSKVQRKTPKYVWKDTEGSEEDSDIDESDKQSVEKIRAIKAKKSNPTQLDEEEEDDWAPEAKKESRVKKDKSGSSQAAFEDEEDEELTPAKRKEKIRAAREKGEWSEEESDSEYGGESSFDDIGASHYSNANGTKTSVNEKNKSSLKGSGEIEDFDDEVDSDSDKIKPISKKAIQNARSSQGTDALGKNHYAGKIAKKTGTNAQDANDITDEHFEGSDLTTSFKEERAKGKINNKTRSALDDLDVEEEEDSQDQAEGVESVKATRAKNVKKSVALDDELFDEIEEDIEGAEGVNRIRAAKNFKPNSASGDETVEAVNSIRDKRMKSLEDLLPDGNADDPQEDVLPEPIDAVAKAKTKPLRTTGTRGSESEESEKLKATEKEKKSQPNLQLVTAIEAPTLTYEGKPIVAESARVRAYLTRAADSSKEHDVHIDDFFDNNAIIKLQSKDLQPGDVVSLVVVFEYMQKSKRISVSGKCVEVQNDDEGSYATLELNEQDQQVFEKFMRLYQLRQEHVTEFLKAARGY